MNTQIISWSEITRGDVIHLEFQSAGRSPPSYVPRGTQVAWEHIQPQFLGIITYNLFHPYFEGVEKTKPSFFQGSSLGSKGFFSAENSIPIRKMALEAEEL